VETPDGIHRTSVSAVISSLVRPAFWRSWLGCSAARHPHAVSRLASSPLRRFSSSKNVDQLRSVSMGGHEVWRRTDDPRA
jgi:hypothetical protein